MTTTNEGSIIVVDLDLVPWCFCESCSVTIFWNEPCFSWADGVFTCESCTFPDLQVFEGEHNGQEET